MSKRALIIGSDRDYCYVIKEFLELRELYTTVVLNYKDGLDRLFYEKPDVAVLELIDQELSPALLNTISASRDFEAISFRSAPEPKTGLRPILIFDDKGQINSLFDFLKLNYTKTDAVKRPADTETVGSLGTTFYPSLLIDIYYKRKSGTLSLSSISNLNIYFLNGLPIFAEGGDVETAIGRILLDRGRIDRENYEKAIDIASTTKQKFGEVLFGMGITSPHELNSYLEIQIEEKIVRGFCYVQGTYEFEEGYDFASRIVSHQISLSKIIYEGVKRYIDVEGLEDRNPVVEVKPKLKSDINTLGLKPKELRFVQLLKPRAHLKDILESSRLEKEEALKLIYFLAIFRLLSVPGLTPDRIGRASIEKRIKESGEDAPTPDIQLGDTGAPVKEYVIHPDIHDTIDSEQEEAKPFQIVAEADNEATDEGLSIEADNLFTGESGAGAYGGPEAAPGDEGTETTPLQFYGEEAEANDSAFGVVYEITEEDGEEPEYSPDALEVKEDDEEESAEEENGGLAWEIGINSVSDTEPEAAAGKDSEAEEGPGEGGFDLGREVFEVDLDFEYKEEDTPQNELRQTITSLFESVTEEDSAETIISEIEKELMRREPPASAQKESDFTIETPEEDVQEPEAGSVTSDSFTERVNRLHPEIDSKDHYEILGIERGATQGEIRDAYYRLVKNYHPDANPNADHDTRVKAEDIFTRITSAYETLSEAEKRQEYDTREELAELKTQAKYIYEAEMAFKKGITLLIQRDYVEAEKKIREAVGMSPEESAYVGAHAWTSYLAAGDKSMVQEQSIKKLEKAIQLNEKIAENHYYLGSIYKNLNDLKNAEKYYRKAIELEPDYIEAKRELRLINTRKINSRNDKKEDKKFWSGLFKR